MDTKGREELLGMQSCQSYQGCPVCLHTWTPGKILGRKQVVCDGYRCFLHRDSAARQKTFFFEGQKYEYRWPRVYFVLLCVIVVINWSSVLVDRNVETRPVPASRDDEFVRSAVGLATEKEPVCGHKSAPLLSKWPGYSWFRMNVPEIMHGECVIWKFWPDSNLIETHNTRNRCKESLWQHRSPVDW